MYVRIYKLLNYAAETQIYVCVLTYVLSLNIFGIVLNLFFYKHIIHKNYSKFDLSLFPLFWPNTLIFQMPAKHFKIFSKFCKTINILILNESFTITFLGRKILRQFSCHSFKVEFYMKPYSIRH